MRKNGQTIGKLAPISNCKYDHESTAKQENANITVGGRRW
jgi:hypothetical protein